MKPLSEFKARVKILFTDIDDTLTDEGRLGALAYQSLWRLHEAGIKVVPVTGRPAGWCEMIARLWPVDGVIGENGGFYFRYIDKEMKRYFAFNEKTQAQNREKLLKIREEVLASIKGCAVASDQFSRLMDLAIDFREDVVPLPDSDIDRIVAVFNKHGAQAKVSSIHVNGWFGTYDKLSMCREFMSREYGLDLNTANAQCAFSGDSPNDEPMFAFFENAFAVANIRAFLPRLKDKPKFIANSEGGNGFSEIADAVLRAR